MDSGPVGSTSYMRADKGKSSPGVNAIRRIGNALEVTDGVVFRNENRPGIDRIRYEYRFVMLESSSRLVTQFPSYSSKSTIVIGDDR